ncbi:MAG: SDR family oxidoreductase [Flavobacteriales bacterium]|jgi:NAD(P)-dependent dehydrogenase (short-subunit alcohol dehydrogenase family)
MSKVILVTGASSGIGLAIAQVLHSRGHRVYGTSRREPSAFGSLPFRMVQMDVTDEPSVERGVDQIFRDAGRLDVVVNNAGLGMIGPVESVSDREVREIFDTNVFGVLHVCRHTLPVLRQTGGGYIINITSIAGQMGLPFRGIYSSSKFAVEGFTESLSQEVRQFGVKVCLIEPGDFRTGINESRKVATRVHNAYGDQSDVVLRQVCEEVSRARTPEVIGHLVNGIIHDPSPALRYRAANLLQRFSLTLMRVLPDRWFENIIMRYYKLGVRG